MSPILKHLPFLALATLGLLAAPVVLAHGGAVDRPISRNLDSDADLEQVVPRALCQNAKGNVRPADPPCTDDEFSRHRIVIEDTCGGQPLTRELSTVQDYVERLRMVEADGSTSRPEIFFDIRSGAAGRGGETRLVRYDGSACPEPRDLFRYPARSTRGRIPHGAVGRDDFFAALHEYATKYRGKEIRLIETYVDRNDAYCCPSFSRTTYFRFKRAADRYVRYETSVRRIKR